MSDPLPDKGQGLPTTGRIAAIDYGQVRVGVALSDVRQQIASPHENYTRRGEQQDAHFFQTLVEQEQIVAFVIGLPVHMSGDESEKSQEARQFGAWLSQTTNLPIQFYDERFSTAAANQHLATAGLSAKQRKKRRDMLAAQIILAAFLDTPREY